MSKKWIVALIILIVVLVGAVAYLNLLKHVKNRLTMRQNGSTVIVKPGDKIVILLDGNITTGYSWEVGTIDETFLKQYGEPTYREKYNPRGLEGVPGKFEFTFEALRIGKTSLRLIYQQPFEKDVEPEKTFTITVDISKP